MVDGIVDKPIFDYIHAAAAYTKLGNLQKRNPVGAKEMQGSVLVRLEQRLQGMLVRKEVGAQQLANILWAAANLFSDIPALLNIVPNLSAEILLKASDTDPQGLSNSLWSAVQLQDAKPEVLKIVLAIVAQIPLKSKDMIPQHVSNSLWAAAKLKDSAPEVLKIVPALVAQIPLKAVGMIPQHLANSLWALKDFPDASPAVPKAALALVQNVPSKISGMDGQLLSNTVEALVYLGESFPIDSQQDIVAASAARLASILPKLKGRDLMFTVPVVIWACVRSDVHDGKLFCAAVARFSSARVLASLTDWGLCALWLGWSCNSCVVDLLWKLDATVLPRAQLCATHSYNQCGSSACIVGYWCHPSFKLLSASFANLRMWSYCTLNKATEFDSFVDGLESEISRRGLSGSEKEILAEREP